MTSNRQITGIIAVEQELGKNSNVGTDEAKHFPPTALANLIHPSGSREVDTIDLKSRTDEPTIQYGPAHHGRAMYRRR